MRLFTIIVSLLILQQIALAQSFKILKLQGKKALVEIDDPDLVELNKSYNTISAQILTDKHTKPSYKRDFGISTSLSYSSLKADTAGGGVTTNTSSLNASLLWNLKRYEVGPILGYESTQAGTSNSTETRYGVAGFYNLNENKITTMRILSVYGEVTVGSQSGTSSGATNTLKLGPNYRWFLISGDHCFSGALLYSIDKSPSGTTSVTKSGFELAFGISTYF